MLLSWWHPCSKMWWKNPCFICTESDYRKDCSLLQLWVFFLKKNSGPQNWLKNKNKNRNKFHSRYCSLSVFTLMYSSTVLYFPSLKINDSHVKHLSCFRYVDSDVFLLLPCFTIQGCEFIIHKPCMENQLYQCNFERQTKNGCLQFLEAL